MPVYTLCPSELHTSAEEEGVESPVNLPNFERGFV